MRKGAKVKYNKDGFGNFQFSIDWRDNAISVMEVVDFHLREYGLEVSRHESDGDYYGFSILPVKKKKK